VHRFWSAAIEPVIGALGPRVIVEMGSGDGIVAGRLIASTTARDATVHVVQHSVAPALDAAGSDVRVHHTDPITAAAGIGEADLVLLDADPNWHTVVGVLRGLARRARDDDRPPPVVLVHDVRWPFGRRDGYADPEQVPQDARQPSSRDGVLPGHGDLAAEGWQTGLWNALREHGPRNGVRCAIDDFLADTASSWTLVDLPGLGGLAVLAPAERLTSNRELARVVDDLRGPRFLGDQCRRLELERVQAEVALHRARHRREDGDADRASVAAELAATTQELAEARAALAELEASALGSEERRALTDALAAAERLADDATARLRTEQTQLARAREHLAEAQREQAVAEARLQSGVQAAAAMERELRDSRDDLAQRLTAASADLDEVRTRVARAEIEGDREREARAGAERRAAALERELEARDHQLTAAQQQERLLADRAAQLDRETRELRAQFDVERARLLVQLERARESRAWRIGHGTTRLLRRLTFRRSLGTSALDVAIASLSRPGDQPRLPLSTGDTDVDRRAVLETERPNHSSVPRS